MLLNATEEIQMCASTLERQIAASLKKKKISKCSPPPKKELFWSRFQSLDGPPCVAADAEPRGSQVTEA